MSNIALFLDRDGVINLDHGYVFRIDEFEFIPGIFELVRAANNLGYKVIVVTNQAGIARGYYTEQEFNTLTEWMCKKFMEEGTKIDDVYFCPYHPEHGIGAYKRESECRKPNPGMLLQAAKDWDLDLKHSVMVGDKYSDIDAAVKANIKKRFLYDSRENNKNAIKIEDLTEVITYL